MKSNRVCLLIYSQRVNSQIKICLFFILFVFNVVNVLAICGQNKRITNCLIVNQRSEFPYNNQPPESSAGLRTESPATRAVQVLHSSRVGKTTGSQVSVWVQIKSNKGSVQIFE